MNSYCWFKMQLMRQLLLLLISLTLCVDPAVTLKATEESEELDSEEFENSLVQNAQDESRNGFVELLNFIDSINHTLTALSTKLAAHDSVFAALNAKIDVLNIGYNALNTQIATFKDKFDTQDTKFITLNEKLGAQDTKFDILNEKFDVQDTKFANLNEKIDAQNVEFAVLSTKISALKTECATPNVNSHAQKMELPAILNSKVDRLTRQTEKLIQLNINTWKGFDSLILSQAKEIRTGESFNGSKLSDITTRASQFSYNGWYTAIVFVNHLDEAIDDFTIYDLNSTSYHPAPNSVPGRTQEVFTFAHPLESQSEGYTSFSYVIPSLDIRIASISVAGAFGAGLAFVAKGTDMKTYYDVHQGIVEGSSVYECCGDVDRNLFVGYKNFYATMVAKHEGDYKTTLRIELIKFSLDDWEPSKLNADIHK